MKKQYFLTKLMGTSLSAVLSMLGFTSCDKESEDMYGTPYTEFEISGLVTDEDGNPLDKIRVMARTTLAYFNGQAICGNGLSDVCDTAYTDVNGHYKLENNKVYGSWPSTILNAEDPDGVYDHSYESVDLKYTGKHHDGYLGKAKATADFVLKKAENTEAE